MRSKLASALAAASALVAFESLTKSTRPRRPTCSIRCLRPAKRREPARDRLLVEPELAHRGNGSRGVLRIVIAAQRGDAGETGDPARGAVRCGEQLALRRIDAFRQRPPRRDADDPPGGPLEPVGDRLRAVIVDRDDCRSRCGHQPLLDGGVARQRAVAVEVIGRDVEEDADARVDAGRKIDLKRRALDHMVAAGARRIEREDRRPDIAAELHVAAGGGEEMRDQRRGSRFAVGAGDGNEGRAGHAPLALAAEELDVADDLDPRRFCLAHRPMRLGMGERHAGREHQGGEIAPVGASEILDRNTRGGGRFDCLGIVVEGRRPARRRRPAPPP